MSSARALALLIALGLPQPIAAQKIRMYEQRLDSLAAAQRFAAAARQAYELAQRRDYTRFDSVVVGPMRIRATPALNSLAQSGADSVVASLKPQYGRALDALVGHVFVVRDEQVREGDRNASYVVIAEVAADGRELEPQVVVPEVGIVRNVLLSKTLRTLLANTDSAFVNWLHSTSLPSDTASSQAWLQARIDLLSSYAIVSRHCYEGDLAACRVALGLTPSRDPVMDWLSAAERRQIVHQLDDRYWVRMDREAARICYGGSDSTCAALLHASREFLPDPIATLRRSELFQLAMVSGGPGAMERALLTRGTPEQRLVAAARLPADSIVRRWLTLVRDVRKPSEDMSPIVAATSMGWILFCGALAYRSSRWR